MCLCIIIKTSEVYLYLKFVSQLNQFTTLSNPATYLIFVFTTPFSAHFVCPLNFACCFVIIRLEGLINVIRPILILSFSVQSTA